MVHWLAVPVDGSDLMTTCSVCHEVKEDDDNPSCPGCTCFFKECGQQVPKVPPCSFGGDFSMPMVLAGHKSCDRYDQQGEPGPITIG